jgi:hypothetical protein
MSILDKEALIQNVKSILNSGYDFIERDIRELEEAVKFADAMRFADAVRKDAAINAVIIAKKKLFESTYDIYAKVTTILMDKSYALE